MFSPKSILIDMDDTLYEERTYVESGMKAVADFLEAERDLPADYSYPSMMAFLDLEGRGKVFDRIVERFEIRQSDGLVDACVEVYRSHKPQIVPYDRIEATLDQLSGTYSLALVTNGLPLMQRNKLSALGLGHFFNAIIYCDESGTPKPSPDGILQALDQLGTAARDALLVGDNPETDGRAAMAAGVSFVRVRTSRFADLPSKAPEVSNLSQVFGLLDEPSGKMNL